MRRGSRLGGLGLASASSNTPSTGLYYYTCIVLLSAPLSEEPLYLEGRLAAACDDSITSHQIAKVITLGTLMKKSG